MPVFAHCVQLGTCAIITVGDKTLTYSAPHDESFVKDGKMYIEGAIFASDLGAVYVDVETDAYKGFMLYYDCANYSAYGESTIIKQNSDGQAYVDEYNKKEEEEITKTTVKGVLLFASIITAGQSEKFKEVAKPIIKILNGVTKLPDLEYVPDVLTGERITTVFRTDCSSEKTDTIYQTIIRDEQGNIKRILPECEFYQ